MVKYEQKKPETLGKDSPKVSKTEEGSLRMSSKLSNTEPAMVVTKNTFTIWKA